MIIRSSERPTSRPARDGTGANTYARVTGILILVSIVAGGFGEFYVPAKLIVAGNATLTAHNIASSQGLFRMGFAGYLIEAACDVALTMLFYVLLRPVDRNIALLAAFFRLISTATFAFAELFYAMTPRILNGAGSLAPFSQAQLNGLALLSLTFYAHGGELFLVFYGCGSTLLGYLIVRSGYIPKALGLLLVLGGVGFIALNFALVLAPALASDVLLLPTTLGMLLLALWLIVRGRPATSGARA